MRRASLDNAVFFQELMLDDADALNTRLYARFLALAGTDRVRQTHYLEGRFENTYLAAEDIPEIASVLAPVKEQAHRRLGLAVENLRAGFWFNVMAPGQRTLPHHHDENEELLSAVYYIKVPEDSGDLILHLPTGSVRIHPEAGKLVLFTPALLHEVTPNLSSEVRLSVAVNVGPTEG